MKKVSSSRAAQLSNLGFKVANNTVSVRAPYGAKVTMRGDKIIVENQFERNTIFLTRPEFLDIAEKPQYRAIEDDYESDNYNERGVWRFSFGGDVSTKIYTNLDSMIDEVQKYVSTGNRVTRKAQTAVATLPVFSEQKYGSFFDSDFAASQETEVA
jgi:hypothetical protein